MAQKLDSEELASFKELLISDMIEFKTIAQLLIETEILTHREKKA